MNTPLQTPPAGCGCDSQPTGTLVPLAVAVERALALAVPVAEVENLALIASLGRVLAHDARSLLPLPPFDNSAMDGYLIRTGDLSGDGPWALPLAGRIAAGDPGDIVAGPGAALRILTGAIVPAEFDAVIMQEDTELRDGSVCFSRRPVPGQHIRRRGGDATEGEVVVPADTEIGPRQAAALAATGAATVPVRRKVRVAIFSTGSELRQPGEPLGPGQIWNSNRYALLSLLKKDWVEIVDLGAIEDNPAALKLALKDACASCDMVVTTGGVSVGDEDHMPRLFTELGGEISVTKVAIKPGKPITFGRLDGAVFVGLPGNPVSAFVTWTIIGARILEKCAGLERRQIGRLLVRVSGAMSRKPGRVEFRPARFTGNTGDDGQQVTLLDAAFSGRVALLSRADGLAVIPADMGAVAEGEVLEFIPF